METIYALVTKPIQQNIAVIRISGDDTYRIVGDLFGESIEKKQNSILVKKLFIGEEFVDEILLLLFSAPNSFTGEDVVELQTHGSIFIVEKILHRLKILGARQAKNGEFTERAFFNKKLDLIQASAINTIINAETKQLQEQASKNLNKEQSKFINLRKSYLEDIVSRIQVNIDYPENNDIPKYNIQNLIDEIKDFKNEIENIINESEMLIKYDKGLIVTLLGIPNTGKSTLLNSILKEEKALISDIQGTTRDLVESIFYLDNIKITLQDTAGHRETTDALEKMGIGKTEEAINKSNLIILLIDPTRQIEEQKNYFASIIPFNKKIIYCYTKSDLAKIENEISISAKHNDISQLLNVLRSEIKNNSISDMITNSYLTSIEQIDSFKEILENLKIALEFLEKSEFIDVIFLELENALKTFKIMLGEEIAPDYIHDLFSKFCIGK